MHLYAKHKDEEQREEISGPIIPELIFHARHEIIELSDRRKTLAQAVCELKGEQFPTEFTGIRLGLQICTKV
jgi:hypothetical protein